MSIVHGNKQSLWCFVLSAILDTSHAISLPFLPRPFRWCLVRHFCPVIIHAAIRSRSILFGWARAEWVMEGCDTGVCKVNTDHLLAKSDHDTHCSLHLVTRQMTVLITLYQVAPTIDSITVVSPLTEPNTTSVLTWYLKFSNHKTILQLPITQFDSSLLFTLWCEVYAFNIQTLFSQFNAGLMLY